MRTTERAEGAPGTGSPPAGGADGSFRLTPRLAVWVLHVVLPLLGLWLLLAQPQLDLIWEDHLSHFWLVMAVAAINVVLGLRMNRAAGDHGDARLFLVSLTFLSSAGFLFLHALVTPQVVTGEVNGGFVVASPIGLFVAACFAAASSINLSTRRAAALMRFRGVLTVGLLLVMVAWGVLSVLPVPPLDFSLDAEQAVGPLAALAVAGVSLYVIAALRYYLLYRRRRAVMLVSLITAFVLLAEALVAMALARSWQLTWWEWHVLMAFGFGFVAYSAHVHYRREGSATSLWSGISLEETIREIREEYGAALEELVEAMRRREEIGTDGDVGPLAGRLAARLGLSEGQTGVLERAAEALAAEREQILRLGALVAVGRETKVILEENDLLRRTLAIAGKVFGRDRLRIGLVRDEQLVYPRAWGRATGHRRRGPTGRCKPWNPSSPPTVRAPP